MAGSQRVRTLIPCAVKDRGDRDGVVNVRIVRDRRRAVGRVRVGCLGDGIASRSAGLSLALGSAGVERWYRRRVEGFAVGSRVLGLLVVATTILALMGAAMPAAVPGPTAALP
jgi:hypothetical protein